MIGTIIWWLVTAVIIIPLSIAYLISLWLILRGTVLFFKEEIEKRVK